MEGESNSGERAQIMRQIYMTRSEFVYPPPRSLLIPGAEPTPKERLTDYKPAATVKAKREEAAKPTLGF